MWKNILGSKWKSIWNFFPRQFSDNKSYGVDFKTKDIGDNWKELVLEPRTMKSDSLGDAFLVVRRILRINYHDYVNDEPPAALRSFARTSNDWLSRIFGGI